MNIKEIFNKLLGGFIKLKLIFTRILAFLAVINIKLLDGEAYNV